MFALPGPKGDRLAGIARGSAVLALTAALAAAGCGGSGPHGSATPTTKTAMKGEDAATCRAPAGVLAGVYHPSRLHVLSPCLGVAGTVVGLSHEVDGDLHIALDTAGALTNAVNRSHEDGNLVVEFMPRDGGHLPAPAVGERIRLTGAWVLDANHGWNELHPVWSETRAGVTYHSGPQYGGSPADVGSRQAAKDCTSKGARCQGYGGGE